MVDFGLNYLPVFLEKVKTGLLILRKNNMSDFLAIYKDSIIHVPKLGIAILQVYIQAQRSFSENSNKFV